ncbi:MAG TPA: luciferase family protein, partial [Aggregatilineales bacterium]|nr:luciferase family protein [Aggregatilineales bacterium]
HRFGGVEFKLGTREIGHIHGDWLVDIPLTNAFRAQLVVEGRAQDHHIYPGTGLISFHLKSDRDIDNALWLLRLSYLRNLAQLRKRGLADASTESVDLEREIDNLNLSQAMRSLLYGLVGDDPSVRASRTGQKIC